VLHRAHLGDAGTSMSMSSLMSTMWVNGSRQMFTSGRNSI
jgi:hypothetical protein